MPSAKAALIKPLGGVLANVIADPEGIHDLHALARRLPALRISERATCNLEMLAVGGFSPRDRFMGREDYLRVLEEARLTNSYLFPTPVTLSVQADHGVHLES